MDIHSLTKKQNDRPPPGARVHTDANRDRAWPTSKARDGMYYGFTDKFGTKMVAQTQETWAEIGTMLEKQRRLLADQDKALKDQNDEIRRLRANFDELANKHENLREARRSELRKNIEEQVSPPAFAVPQSVNENDWFTPPKGSKT